MYGRGGGNRNGGGTKVCEFFLQGRCKFGDNCKFEHPVAQSGSNSNRFASLSGQNALRGRSNNAKDDLPYNLSRDLVVADMKEERPQWPFSAYGPGKDAPRQLFGGFPIEQSPEEMRVLYYLAQASGNPQTAVQGEQELFQRMSQQVEKIINDPDGAIQYILDGDKEHPNRRDLNLLPGQANSTGNSNPFSQSKSTSAFGQPSSLGTSSGSAFGQPSTPFGGAGATSAFGQPSQPSMSSAFGQPSQMGAKPAFGQPSQPSAGSAFGQPSQLGGSSAFGQPSQPATASPFGQPSQIGGGSAFGKPSGLGTSGAFGQPSSLGQSRSPFGQPSQPSSTFSNQQSSGGFGQPSQPIQSSPFATAAQQNQQTNTGSGFGQSGFGQQPQASQNPFGGAAQNQQSPFATASQTNTAQNPFSQNTQSSASSFGQPSQQQSQTQTQANTSAVKSPFAPTHTHPPPGAVASSGDTATPSVNSYAQHANGQLRSWRGRPVAYIDGAPYFSKTGNVNNSQSLERVWFPEGPPAGNPYTADSEELYSKAGGSVEETYRRCSEQGIFQGSVPLLAPQRAWTRYDI
ncbi:hypothetical protein K461DRAFT_292200 [Myriangium duriaei CBS 260.36]|uniref:C3H1-type domain-containing protein n=1 Tax=Myriangium duriaei CBS 260.36 TaxID=1168546 RepID=A0A9P4J755_9PEZI|nr:hypothetical protein K461DRAFT_292200 [Myriangium duriaei CBS 260.36]